MTAQTNLPPFHLAFPVRDLEEARAFYGVKLGCPEGRSSPEWIDFNFYGHQIVAHLAPGECGHKATSAVDSHNVPVRHFGAVLHGTMGRYGQAPDRCRYRVRDRTVHPLQGRGRRTSHHVLPRPVGQRAGIQGLQNLDSLFAK